MRLLGLDALVERLLELVVRDEEGCAGGLGRGAESLTELGLVGELGVDGLAGHGLGSLGLLAGSLDVCGRELPLLGGAHLSRHTLGALDLCHVRVQLEHGAEVLEGVALLGGLGETLAGRADLGLDLIRVDDARKVRVVHHGAWQRECLLHVRGSSVGAEDAVMHTQRTPRQHEKTRSLFPRVLAIWLCCPPILCDIRSLHGNASGNAIKTRELGNGELLI